MTNILVTGGAGFIATNFVYYWLDKYPDDHVVALDALTYAGNRENLFKAEKNPKFEFVHGNILEEHLVETLLRNHGIDKIVHFAAESHVDRSIAGPDPFIETNIVGTHTLLKCARKIWFARKSRQHHFHHISTDEVYGTLGQGAPPFSETSPYAPNSPYAASKASSDHLVRAYHKTYGLPVTISNCSNNYGPFQFPEKFIPLVITNILAGQSIPVYGDGKQIRDWLHVDDHNIGVDLILEKGIIGETYNIGGNNEWANLDIARLLCKQVHIKILQHQELSKRFPDSPSAKGSIPDALITHVKDRAGHDRRYAINSEKMNSNFNYSPAQSFETAIENTIDWYIENESWWRTIKRKSEFG